MSQIREKILTEKIKKLEDKITICEKNIVDMYNFVQKFIISIQNDNKEEEIKRFFNLVTKLKDEHII